MITGAVSRGSEVFGNMDSRTAGMEAGITGNGTAGMEAASAAGKKADAEWGVDEIAATGAGYTPAGMLKGFSLKALVPDYSFAGLPEWFGYILSAVIGAAVLIIVFRLIGDVKKPQKQQVQA